MRSSRILASRELAVIRAAKAIFRLKNKHAKAGLLKYTQVQIDAEAKAATRLRNAVMMLKEYERKHKP